MHKEIEIRLLQIALNPILPDVEPELQENLISSTW